MPPGQIQRGGVDCGLFALAFACDLANGNGPSEIAYCQSGMRQHLIRCLENEHFQPFPCQKRLQKSPRPRRRERVKSINLHLLSSLQSLCGKVFWKIGENL